MGIDCSISLGSERLRRSTVAPPRRRACWYRSPAPPSCSGCPGPEEPLGRSVVQHRSGETGEETALFFLSRLSKGKYSKGILFPGPCSMILSSAFFHLIRAEHGTFETSGCRITIFCRAQRAEQNIQVHVHQPFNRDPWKKALGKKAGCSGQYQWFKTLEWVESRWHNPQRIQGYLHGTASKTSWGLCHLLLESETQCNC